MFATRPDLGLLYYPDPYAFIWFVSRTERLLSDLDPSILAKLPSVVIQAHDMLSNSLHGAATAFLLSTVTSNETTKVYWEQWLGAADKDKDGNLEPHGDDRLFTTGAAINDLINIWTKKAGSGLQWKDDAPSSVQSLVAQAAAYLNSTVLNPDSLYYNAFFSGSVKGQDSLPYAYPATFMQYLNGTDLPPNPSALYITTDLIIAMQGCPSAEDYQSMVDERHFEYYKTPVQFDGFNAVQIFPFWSAAPLTMSIDLLALAKVGLIIN
ncbi:hypothetical protein Pelo_17792 [Pelomyxa schiedti]|nr:hypothetical protein Pelo_17792 [Pelomyxa schiedti]